MKMTKEDADKAHEVSELFQELIVGVGATMLKNLNPAQQEYVLIKVHDEFRFWRIEDELK